MAKAMLKTLFAAMFAAAIMGAPAMADTAHDFAFDKIEGGKLPMSQFKGKAVLAANLMAAAIKRAGKYDYRAACTDTVS